METKTNLVAPKILPIPIKDAKTVAKTWQGRNTNRAKAFLIPVADLLECFKEMGIAQYDSSTGNYIIHQNVPHDIRVYMGTENNPTYWPDPKKGYGNKLLIVGAYWDSKKNEYLDIIDRGSIGDDVLDGTPQPIGSGVFDFTVPCPSECDSSSPLF